MVCSWTELVCGGYLKLQLQLQIVKTGLSFRALPVSWREGREWTCHFVADVLSRSWDRAYYGDSLERSTLKTQLASEISDSLRKDDFTAWIHDAGRVCGSE